MPPGIKAAAPKAPGCRRCIDPRRPMRRHSTKPQDSPPIPPGVRMVRVADVKVPPGRRPTRKAKDLAESIETLGLLNPITVTEDLRLIAGGNRLEAHYQLGLKWILAIVLSLDNVRAELAALDENAVRDEGTALERAESTARRKALYELLHP